MQWTQRRTDQDCKRDFLECGAETTQKKPKGRDGTSKTTALTDTAAPGSEGTRGANQGPTRGQLKDRAWKVEQVRKSPKCPAEWSPWTQSSWQEATILDFFWGGWGRTKWWKPVEMTLSVVTLGKRNLFRKPVTSINAKIKPKTLPTFMDLLGTCCQETRASESHILSPKHCPCPSLLLKLSQGLVKAAV